jgi:SAM-dependent methyltransferase
VTINPLAGAAFSSAAEAYERGRPSYPHEAVERLVSELGMEPGRRVLDLAAGTGKFTRLLLPTGADLVAVEPVAAMRAQLRASAGTIALLAGTAELLPFRDGSVDAICVAQAFHWFDAARALPEIARVLRPGSGLGLIWNERDESLPWAAALTRIMRWDVQMPYRVGTDWRAEVDGCGLFTEMQRQKFNYEQELDIETLVQRVASTSYIAAMEERERASLLGQVRDLVAAFPPRFMLPYVTDVYWCRRLDQAT